jgi:hypothetical protein
MMSMKKNFIYKMLAVGASLFMMSTAMVTLQGCGSDDDAPIVANTDPNPNPSAGVTTATNVFMDDIIGDLSYFNMHGSTSTDRSRFLVTFNETKAEGEPATSQLFMMDADSIADASPALASSGTTTKTITGTTVGASGATTISFRSTWTQDDTKIMLAGADRFYVINAATLEVLNGAEGDDRIAGQNHDALPTDDGKYALLTLRTKPYEVGSGDETKMDGEIQLYDVDNGEPVGNPVSVCNACHSANKDAILCGLDGEIALDTADNKYKGTVYIAGHGAHFAKVDLVIDPSNTDDPIAALVKDTTLNKVDVSTTDRASYKLHDARIDGTDMFWSTYLPDAGGLLHYGKVDLSDGSVTADLTIEPDDRATSGAYYCASGQTATHFMPITMTNEGYITAIPKSTVVAP